jgi:myo-inositol-1(or 4)-monophosphatase
MDDLALLLTSLRAAGKLAMGFHGKNPKRWNKPDGTIVTEADIAVDTYLKTTIGQARPNDGWLSEETKDTPDRLSKTRLWIADPIDGTRAFADATRFWGIGVALIENGEPLLGGIYCPVDDVMFHAVKGGGAFRNDVRLSSPQSNGPVIVPRAAVASVEALGLATQIGSSWPMLLRFALVAEGQNAGAMSIGNKQDWDIAAGVLLVTESGGLVTTQHGERMRFNRPDHQQAGLVAAQQKWHRQLVDSTGTLPWPKPQ